MENDDVYYDTLKDGSIYTSLEVTKNTKGYNYSIKCAGLNPNAVKEKLYELEAEIKEKFDGK